MSCRVLARSSGLSLRDVRLAVGVLLHLRLARIASDGPAMTTAAVAPPVSAAAASAAAVAGARSGTRRPSRASQRQQQPVKMATATTVTTMSTADAPPEPLSATRPPSQASAPASTALFEAHASSILQRAAYGAIVASVAMAHGTLHASIVLLLFANGQLTLPHLVARIRTGAHLTSDSVPAASDATDEQIADACRALISARLIRPALASDLHAMPTKLGLTMIARSAGGSVGGGGGVRLLGSLDAATAQHDLPLSAGSMRPSAKRSRGGTARGSRTADAAPRRRQHISAAASDAPPDREVSDANPAYRVDIPVALRRLRDDAIVDHVRQQYGEPYGASALRVSPYGRRTVAYACGCGLRTDSAHRARSAALLVHAILRLAAAQGVVRAHGTSESARRGATDGRLPTPRAHHPISDCGVRGANGPGDARVGHRGR